MKENVNPKLAWFGIPKIYPYVRKYRWLMIAMAGVQIVCSLLDCAVPLFNQYALNHFIALNTLDTVKLFALVFALTIGMQASLNFIAFALAGKIEMSVDRDLRDVSFNHLQTLSFSYFNQNSVGYIHARVMSDTGKIGEMCAWSLLDAVWNSAYILMMFIIMFAINARLALVIMVILPPAAFIMGHYRKKLIELNRQIRDMNSRITGSFNESITGISSIKTLVIEDDMAKDFEAQSHDMFTKSVRAAHFNALLTSFFTLLSSFALGAVLWRGGIITMEGLMQIGTLSVFMTYAMNMLDPLQILISVYANMIAVRVNIERFTGLMETESDVTDIPEVIARYGDTFNPKKENWEDIKGDIEFRDVSFVYPDGNEIVLDHFNLKVKAGTNVAIVGETGAGKSTLINLICRFYEPTEGAVLIDGMDVRKRSQLWLHSHIGYVLQTPHLFSGTIRENLRYGNERASDEEIMRALKLVHAEHILAKTDRGLDGLINESGDNLSVGEKQLLSFARAILADPAILLLDEATSSVDTVKEKAVQNAIAVLIRGRTSFVVAHRLSTVVNADIILAVKDGRIIERGTHRELMKQKGYYYQLYTRQFADMAVDLARADLSEEEGAQLK